ncbi:DgyrCDS9640 [Dimorphilus gyrociliatus]|uniref:DgyrCDS9640 n=1 Tax=Dimorphilus gyrociliatus TaxID=2664684 RepID=A0A7I8VZS0_9ANNE|nr:DgyrCDS9640 [Dimorphilus gyrociliatus]
MALVGARQNYHDHGSQPILAANLPYYQGTVLSQQDVPPDRPIGYGAFGVGGYGPKEWKTGCFKENAECLSKSDIGEESVQRAEDTVSLQT